MQVAITNRNLETASTVRDCTTQSIRHESRMIISN